MSGFKSKIKVKNTEFSYFNIQKFAQKFDVDLDRIPFSIKILIENILRNEQDDKIAEKFVKHNNKNGDLEFFFSPARVLMQDFTGVPAVVDLAAIRDEMKRCGKDPHIINPINPTHLIIDHSVQVDKYGNKEAESENIKIEFARNKERYEFLKWGQSSFENFKVVPPGYGICHQVNLEYIAKTVWTNKKNDEEVAYFDTVIGTDSHTTMVNAIGVLGWGVGGIEAESAMLGQPISMIKPDVVGVKLTGKLNDGISSMDLVLTITNELRKKGVVGKFVEYFGKGVSYLSIPDRATVSNMAPEYGATCGIFPIDEETIKYFKITARSEEQIELIEKYAKEQGVWFDPKIEAEYDDILEIDLNKIELSLAGPKRPQDRISLSKVSNNFKETFKSEKNFDRNKLSDGSVVVAAITSCTNTSNPKSLIAAGLIAKKAFEAGLKSCEYVKTSFSPGSKVAGQYMIDSGLQEYLNKMGFYFTGYGCMTCIGNSGPLKDEIREEIEKELYTVAAVLSGNRNFEGRVHPLTKANYLASPLLVVAYAIAGNINIDITNEPLGKGNNGQDVFLKDVMPSDNEISEILQKFVKKEIFEAKNLEIFAGDENWQNINTAKTDTYEWPESTYIESPPYFDQVPEICDIKNAKILAVFGDSITTDHISPAGNISIKSPAAKYLLEKGVEYEDFNSYGARRGSHNVMMRGTFANIRIKNMLLENIEGGLSKLSNGEISSIYDVAMENQALGVKSIVFAGKEYGSGSSRDWAAKGTKLLGISAIIAESFERIHRSNLAGMGVLPLEFKDGQKNENFNLLNVESLDIIGISKRLKPKQELDVVLTYKNGESLKFKAVCRLDTLREIEYFLSGSIFHYIVSHL